MVRGGAKKEENAEAEERKRLKRLALKNNLLSDRQAAAGSGSHNLRPSKLMMKHHGKDIIRKSQRSGKNRYLFSFPGLLAPISGGKIGELKDLGTKNPILYLEFPQGQMKLFGTIVYPKNRYLTLQFSRSGKNVSCEDYFDNMIVFSDAWWIGRKDENPEEARLEFPAELNVEQMEYDFKGGAGETSDKKPVVSKPREKLRDEKSPKHELEEDSSNSQNSTKEFTELTPTRHSARMAGKTFKFAEASSGDDFIENGGESSEEEEEKVEAVDVPKSDGYKKTNSSNHVVLDIDVADAEIDTPVPEKGKQPAKSALKTKEHAQSNNKGPLVQATISTLFKKAGDKGVNTDAKEKKDNVKVTESRRKEKRTKEKKTGTECTAQKKKVKVQLTSKKKRNKVETEDDDIQEFTSASEECIESSDDDWVA